MAAWTAPSHWQTRPADVGDAMDRLHHTVAVAAALLLFAGGGFVAVGQDGPATEDVLFEIVVPARAVPDSLRALYFEAQTIGPGALGIVDADAENMTGRAIYVDSGGLLVEPLTDAFIWRQEATYGADPEDVVAGTPLHLAAGDLILLPTIPDTDSVGDAVLRIANPGTEMAVIYGFHLCGGGGSPTWPDGMGHIPPAGGVSVGAASLAPLKTEGAVIRLSRTMMGPGTAMAVKEEVLFGLYRLESGIIDATYTSESGTGTVTWKPGGPMKFPTQNYDWELMASSEVPASLLSLKGLESTSLPPAE
jgi:hypothetical protein